MKALYWIATKFVALVFGVVLLPFVLIMFVMDLGLSAYRKLELEALYGGDEAARDREENKWR